MRSIVSSQFRKNLEKLPESVQSEARAGFQKWKDNPASVGWKRLAGPVSDMWSVQIGNRYRAIGILSKQDNAVVWTFVGSHEDYNNYIKVHASISQTAALRAHKDRLTAPRTRVSTEQFSPTSNKIKPARASKKKRI